MGPQPSYFFISSSAGLDYIRLKHAFAGHMETTRYIHLIRKKGAATAYGNRTHEIAAYSQSPH